MVTKSLIYKIFEAENSFSKNSSAFTAEIFIQILQVQTEI